MLEEIAQSPEEIDSPNKRSAELNTEIFKARLELEFAYLGDGISINALQPSEGNIKEVSDDLGALIVQEKRYFRGDFKGQSKEKQKKYLLKLHKTLSNLIKSRIQGNPAREVLRKYTSVIKELSKPYLR